MVLLLSIFSLAVTVITWVILIQVAVSWLLIFGVININHPQAKNLVRILERVTEPLYRPIRKFVPPIGGIDLTPLIVILGLSLLEQLLISALI